VDCLVSILLRSKPLYHVKVNPLGERVTVGRVLMYASSLVPRSLVSKVVGNVFTASKDLNYYFVICTPSLVACIPVADAPL
jgi:hypothetical protein